MLCASSQVADGKGTCLGQGGRMSCANRCGFGARHFTGLLACRYVWMCLYHIWGVSGHGRERGAVHGGHLKCVARRS